MKTSSSLSQDWEKEEIKNMFRSRTRCDWDRVEVKFTSSRKREQDPEWDWIRIKFTSSRKQEQDPEWYWDLVEFEIETLPHGDDVFVTRKKDENGSIFFTLQNKVSKNIIIFERKL